MIPLAKPDITDQEIQAVVDVMKSGNLAMGQKVKEFEELVADYVGVKHAVSVTNGTSALYIILKAIGLENGERVLTTPYSFVASTNCILWAGGEPLYKDINRDTYLMDLPKAAFHSRVGELINITTMKRLPVDVFGNPAETTNNDILDSCESLGSDMDRPFKACAFAFYPNKQISTCGEGGVICTNDKGIADFARAFRNQGREEGDTWLTHTHFGLNFRMTDVQAAVGIVQMKRLPEILDRRMEAYQTYKRLLSPYFRMQRINSGFSPFVLTIEIEKNREEVIRKLSEAGIQSKPYFPLITDQKYMVDMGYDSNNYPIAQEVASKTLALPFYSTIQKSEIDYVCRKVNRCIINL